MAGCCGNNGALVELPDSRVCGRQDALIRIVP
jgi:hypothetical protein